MEIDEKARRVLELWEREPLRMVVDELKVEPDTFQVELMNAFGRRRLAAMPRIALKSAKGPGKTAGEAWAILAFLVTRGLLYRTHDVKIGCTSITGDNIDMNLWPELSKWIHRSEFLSRTLKWSAQSVRLRERPANVFAERRTWPKKGDAQAQADALAGLHGDHVGFVLDESGGIPQGVMVTCEAVLATEGQEAFILQAGNPTHVTGPLHRACTTDRHLWFVITITGDPDNPNRSKRIRLEWAKQQIASYGRDNPWVKVNVLGEFPPASINALLGVEEVEAAMNRHLPRDVYEWSQKRLGVDVARFGDDRTVLFPRQGLAAFRPVVMRGARTTTIATRIAKARKDWKPEVIFVDDTGHWGHGVIDLCTTAGMPVLPVVYHAPSPDKRYKTVRDLMWIEGAKWVRNGGALPKIESMIRELTVPTYTFIGGQFVVQSKDQIKEILGESPDLSDGLFETFTLPEMPSQSYQELHGMQSGKVKVDADPFAQQLADHLAGGGRAITDDDYPDRGID